MNSGLGHFYPRAAGGLNNTARMGGLSHNTEVFSFSFIKISTWKLSPKWTIRPMWLSWSSSPHATKSSCQFRCSCCTKIWWLFDRCHVPLHSICQRQQHLVISIVFKALIVYLISLDSGLTLMVAVRILLEKLFKSSP